MGFDSVKMQIENFANDCGRDPRSVRLIAVSKTKPAEDIERVYRQGQREFGENYADELIEKAQTLAHLTDIHWVFIGQLQSNKIKRIVASAHEIQTIASEKHARYVDRYAQEYGKTRFPIYICVNAGDEDQKQGVALTDVAALAAFIGTKCPHLELQGIMAIPPATYADKSCTVVPDLYRTLRERAHSVGKGKLSLGMSGDLRIAIAAGSDTVRIGTAIFGDRG